MNVDRHQPSSFYGRYGKRAMDVVLSAMGLALLSPVLLLVAAAVRWRLGGPALFVQCRAGRGGRLFRLYKFRSMTDARDASGRLAPDADRLTRFGRWLRETSLDELPELWNVLRGDMSLVGPRPLLADYLPLYSAEQSRRHETRPGLTGWAQVECRNVTSWPVRLRQDVWYVENLSFSLDLTILVRTVGAVLSRRGVQADGHATMPAFRGAVDAEGGPDTEAVRAA